MRVTTNDTKNRFGEWAQRVYVGEKYTWTVSGVLWNNIKERCQVGGATQTREPTYVGTTNEFSGFQDFVEWHRNQVGYNMGYQLDADILCKGNKKYSPDTCVLIPAGLNKFLQTSEAKRGLWPQGIQVDKKRFCVRVGNNHLASVPLTQEGLNKGRSLFKAAKESRARDWAVILQTKDYSVDPRVISYFNNYEHNCTWRGNDFFSN